MKAARTLFLGCTLLGLLEVLTAAQAIPESSRIATLREETLRGAPGAVEQFWKNVAAEGAPLTEGVSKDGRYVLVTFLWRGAADTKNVVVVGQLGQLGGTDLPDNQLTRLANTDVWFRSYWLPRDARAIYRLGLNDSLEPTDNLAGEALQQRTAAWKPDPLNPKRWTTFLPTSMETVYSMVELPGAPARPWIVRQLGTPTGQVQRHDWKSTVLNNDRQVWVYTPPGYRADAESYGLVLATDGFAYTNTMLTTTILDNLIAAKRIPPVVAVFVGNAAGARVRELSCYEPFVEFLAKELVPWVQSTYNVTRDPSMNVIVGFSVGGLTASFVGLRHPELFGNVLSQSGSYWWKPAGDVEGEWLSRQYASTPKAPLRFYMEVGSLEMGSNRGATPQWVDTDRIPYGPSMLVVNRHFRDILKLKGYAVEYAEFGGGHDALHWQSTLPAGLIALLGTERRTTTSSR